jgi:hypothetical protein
MRPVQYVGGVALGYLEAHLGQHQIFHQGFVVETLPNKKRNTNTKTERVVHGLKETNFIP